MNTYVGRPGSVHDAHILANSVVFERGEAGTLVPDQKQHIGGVEVPIVVLGDPAYPLLPWLIRPFTATGPLTCKQRCFNYQYTRARVIVECAFGRLKGRSLLKRIDTDVGLCQHWLLHAVSFTIYVKSMATVSMMIGYRKRTEMNLLLHRLQEQYKLRLLAQLQLECAL